LDAGFLREASAGGCNHWQKGVRIVRKRVMWTGWLLVLGLVVLISACGGEETVRIRAVGDMVVERYDLSGFDQVEVAGFFEAEITQGEGYEVVVEAERALVPYLEVSVRGKRLQVGLNPDIGLTFEDASQQVEIALPALTRARISNHSTLELMGFTVENSLRLEAADFSELHAAIEAGEVQVEVSNHSTLELTGSASQVTGKVTDHSSADLTGLAAAGVNVDTDAHSELRQ
jgi:hypothetical protein